MVPRTLTTWGAQYPITLLSGSSVSEKTTLLGNLLNNGALPLWSELASRRFDIRALQTEQVLGEDLLLGLFSQLRVPVDFDRSCGISRFQKASRAHFGCHMGAPEPATRRDSWRTTSSRTTGGSTSTWVRI